MRRLSSAANWCAATKSKKGVTSPLRTKSLKALEAHGDHSIEITEFVPLSEVDPVYFEESYYLATDTGANKAYRLLTDAMESSERVALGRYTMRGKEHLVLIRPYAKGLILHTLYYADEVKAVDEFDRAVNEPVKETELTLAKKLIDELTQKKFDPAQYHDNYRDRVNEAAHKKIEGAGSDGSAKRTETRPSYRFDVGPKGIVGKARQERQSCRRRSP